MRSLRHRWAAALGIAALALMPAAPARAQPAPPPPAVAPPPSAEPDEACVPLHGHLGCAARLYAQLLCRVVGQPWPLRDLQASLASRFTQAAIDFRGITPGDVEAVAIEDHVPELCPARSRQIQELFAPLTGMPPPAEAGP